MELTSTPVEMSRWLPAGWELCPVGKMGEVVTGKALAKNAPGEQRPYLRTKNVFDGRIDINDVLTMPMTDAEFEHFKVIVGDVLLNEGQSLELVGRCATYNDEYPRPCAIQNQLIRFRARHGVSGDFASHLFRYCQRTGVFAKIALKTTSIAHLGGKRFENLELPWPIDEDEQQAIAEALSDVDALLDGLDRLIAKKRDLKQAAMQQLLTGRTRLPGFNDEWPTVRLGEYVSFLKTGSHSRAVLGTDGPIHNVHYGDIHASPSVSLCPTHLPTLRADQCPRLDRLEDGDLVLADASEDRGGVGKSVEIENATGREVVAGLHTIAARFDPTVLADGFKGYLQFCRPFADGLRRLAAGTKVYATMRSHVAGIEMRLPSPDEQRAIARVFRDMDAEIDALERRRAKTHDLKIAMMQELLTGKTRLVPAGETYDPATPSGAADAEPCRQAVHG